MEIDIALCLPRDAETVRIVRDVAVTALRRLGVTPQCADDIRLALSEACTNVIAHSEADDQYEVRLQVDQQVCQVRVVDAGRGFDVEELASVAPSPHSPRGRGVLLMRALVDSSDFRSEPEAGTIVHLVKALDLEPHGALARLGLSRAAASQLAPSAALDGKG